MTTVLGTLFVDLEGIRARYECLRSGCMQTVEGPVYGAEDVRAFVAVIRNDHRARCIADAPQQGGHR
ncbi:hypothetical protein ACWD1Z_23425 [Streptomyces sp. NPDC002784]